MHKVFSHCFHLDFPDDLMFKHPLCACWPLVSLFWRYAYSYNLSIKKILEYS